MFIVSKNFQARSQFLSQKQDPGNSKEEELVKVCMCDCGVVGGQGWGRTWGVSIRKGKRR